MENPAHDTRIEVDGDVFWVRRDFDLMRRIEQAFGPLEKLNARLRVCEVTADELVQLTRIALKSQESGPALDDVRTHVFEAGIQAAAQQLVVLVMHLFAGNARAVEWLDAEARKAAGEDEAPDPLLAA